ncbi:MAG: hypothetical protein AAFN07_08045, partial [Pseudomonadota bacterium]
MNLIKQLFCITLCIAPCLAGPAHAADTPEWDEVISAEALREDLTALYGGLRAAHPDLFAHRAKSEYDEKFESMLKSLNEPMRRFDAQLM